MLRQAGKLAVAVTVGYGTYQGLGFGYTRVSTDDVMYAWLKSECSKPVHQQYPELVGIEQLIDMTQKRVLEKDILLVRKKFEVIMKDPTRPECNTVFGSGGTVWFKTKVWVNGRINIYIPYTVRRMTKPTTHHPSVVMVSYCGDMHHVREWRFWMVHVIIR
jgi:hypothetical protein